MHQCIQISVIVLILSPSNSSSGDSDDSDYIPTPLRAKLRRPLPISVPHHCIFLDLKQIERFADHLNDMRGVKHMNVREGWYHLKWSPVEWEGSQQLHMCDGCRCTLKLKPSSENTTLANNDINLAAQVAFTTAGCTYTMYCKALQFRHQAGEQQLFYDDYRNPPPHSQRLGKWYEREKQLMKNMNQEKSLNLGAVRSPAQTEHG